MSSRRSLIVLTTLALVSLGVVAVDSGGSDSGAVHERRLVPRYQRSAVGGVRIERGGQPAVVLEAKAGGFTMTAPARAAVDEAVVEDFLGTIEVATYRRAVPRRSEHGLSSPRAVIALRLGTSDVSISLGAQVDGIDRAWVGTSLDSRAYLVDGFVWRALDRTAADLRTRQVFLAQPHEVAGVEVHKGDTSLVVSGPPLAIHRTGPGKVRMDAAAASRLLDRLEKLVLRRFIPDGDVTGAAGDEQLRVRVIGSHPTRELSVVGPCPGAANQTVVRSSVGTGCVDSAAITAIAAFAVDPAAHYDRRLIGAEPYDSVTIASPTERVVLRRWGAGWRFADGKDATTSAVRRALTALDVPRGPPVDIPVSATPDLTITLAKAGETRVIRVLRDGTRRIARRDDEPVGFVVTQAELVAVSPRALDYRDRDLVGLEPVNLVEAIRRVRGKVTQHVVRGALLEDWSVRAPAAAKTASMAAITALRAAGGRLRATRFVAAAAAPVHGFAARATVVELQFDQPMAARRTRVVHRISLGARTRGGCLARLDDEPAVFEIEASACAAFADAWAK